VLLEEWVVTGATLVFRARHRQVVLPLPDTAAHTYHPLLHDAWIALVIACIADVVPIPDRLIDYRVHPAQQIGTLHPTVRASVQLRESRIPQGPTRSRLIENLPELETLVERLAASRAAGVTINASGLRVTDRLDHYRFRMRLPAQRWRRLPLIAREFASGRYARHSRGIRSMVRDLVEPAAQG
jgi:hypothetical protein